MNIKKVTFSQRIEKAKSHKLRMTKVIFFPLVLIHKIDHKKVIIYMKFSFATILLILLGTIIAAFIILGYSFFMLFCCGNLNNLAC